MPVQETLNVAHTQPKKMVIYKRNFHYRTNKELQPTAIRQVVVHHTFEGIGVKGQIDFQAFKKLADYLEPNVDPKLIQVMGL